MSTASLTTVQEVPIVVAVAVGGQPFTPSDVAFSVDNAVVGSVVPDPTFPGSPLNAVFRAAAPGSAQVKCTFTAAGQLITLTGDVVVNPDMTVTGSLSFGDPRPLS